MCFYLATRKIVNVLVVSHAHGCIVIECTRTRCPGNWRVLPRNRVRSSYWWGQGQSHHLTGREKIATQRRRNHVKRRQTIDRLLHPRWVCSFVPYVSCEDIVTVIIVWMLQKCPPFWLTCWYTNFVRRFSSAGCAFRPTSTRPTLSPRFCVRSRASYASRIFATVI